MNMDCTPFEAGLDYFIKFDKVRHAQWDFADENPFTISVTSWRDSTFNMA